MGCLSNIYEHVKCKVHIEVFLYMLTITQILTKGNISIKQSTKQDLLDFFSKPPPAFPFSLDLHQECISHACRVLHLQQIIIKKYLDPNGYKIEAHEQDKMRKHAIHGLSCTWASVLPSTLSPFPFSNAKSSSQM